MNTTTLAFSPVVIAPEHLEETNTRRVSLLVRCAQIFLVAWFASSLVSGLRAAFWFDGYPVNGPFQLYDPLRRLAAGQHAGTDFQFFHGIGIPFLHYPLFWIFGGHTLAAAELSRQLTSLLLFVSSLAAFLWAIFRKREHSGVLRSTLASPFVAAALMILCLELVFPHGAEPGHSLISGRSTMPLLAFTVLLFPLSRWAKALLVGCAIACAFTFGTEHGISLTLALFVVTAISMIQALWLRSFAIAWENTKFVVLALISALITGSTLFLSFCGTKGARRALHFNLVELPADQFWFFGSPPMPYLTSIRQLLFDHHVILCFLPSFLLVLLVIRTVWVRWRQPLRIAGDWSNVAVLMLTYGVLTAIPLIGILSRHYVFPQTRIFLLVAVLALAHGYGQEPIGRLLSRQVFGQWTGAHLTGFAVSLICAIASIGWASQGIRSATQTADHWQQSAPFSRSLDKHWNDFMTGATFTIDTHRTRPQLTLWSEYAALLEAHYGTFQPAEDYIIHTVGPDRWRRYLDQFRSADPEFVTTMTSQFSFGEWLRNERWEFYEALSNNYLPLRNVEHATIWQRRPGAWVEATQTWQTLGLNKAADTVTVPPRALGSHIMVLQIRYQVTNPWKKLPLIGSTPRYLAEIDGTPQRVPVSLPPYLSIFEFPVAVSGSNPVTLHFRTESFLPGAGFRVQSAAIRELDGNQATAVLFAARRVPSRY